MIYKNEFGVIGTPVYLLVAIITASAILVIFTYSILNIVEESQTDIVKKQIEKILSEAENMFEYADSGSKITVDVNFPDSMNFVVFGAMSQDAISKPAVLTLTEAMSNNYYFVMQNKEVCTYSSNARFCGESVDEIAVLQHGEYIICLELVYFDGRTYVKIY